MLTLHGKGPPTLGFQIGLQAILCDVDIKHCGGAVPAACADRPEVGNGPEEQRKGVLGRKDSLDLVNNHLELISRFFFFPKIKCEENLSEFQKWLTFLSPLKWAQPMCPFSDLLLPLGSPS